MNRTVGSPNPASAWFRSRTSVAHSDSAVPIATTSTGTRLETNSTTTPARMRNTIVLSATGRTLGPTRHGGGFGGQRLLPEPNRWSTRPIGMIRIQVNRRNRITAANSPTCGRRPADTGVACSGHRRSGSPVDPHHHDDRRQDVPEPVGLGPRVLVAQRAVRCPEGPGHHGNTDEHDAGCIPDDREPAAAASNSAPTSTTSAAATNELVTTAVADAPMAPATAPISRPTNAPVSARRSTSRPMCQPVMNRGWRRGRRRGAIERRRPGRRGTARCRHLRR